MIKKTHKNYTFKVGDMVQRKFRNSVYRVQEVNDPYIKIGDSFVVSDDWEKEEVCKEQYTPEQKKYLLDCAKELIWVCEADNLENPEKRSFDQAEEMLKEAISRNLI